MVKWLWHYNGTFIRCVVRYVERNKMNINHMKIYIKKKIIKLILVFNQIIKFTVCKHRFMWIGTECFMTLLCCCSGLYCVTLVIAVVVFFLATGLWGVSELWGGDVLPWTGTSPDRGSVDNFYISMLLCPAPPFPPATRFLPGGATCSCPFPLSLVDCILPTQDHSPNWELLMWSG